MQFIKLLEILNNHWSDNKDLYIHPHIPSQKLKNASSSCKIPAEEEIAGLLDCTIFGSANDAIIFGSKGIYIHNEFMDNSLINFSYTEFPKMKFRCKEGYILVNDFKTIAISRSKFDIEDLLSILLDIKEAM